MRTLSPAALIVITDLDGTLLDEKSYSYQACLPAIQKLKSAGIPLILCSSKPFSEILPLWRELDLGAPFIVENGGAIYFPEGYFSAPLPGFKSQDSFKILELGTDVLTLRRVLAETAARCRAKVRSFGTMKVDEIRALTGLTQDQAGLALKRRYDEPFLIEGGDGERLFRALTGQGFTVTRGDQFFHLIGGHEKGRAVRILLDLYGRRDAGAVSVGLGNSANDLPLLREVDRPILIRRANGSWDAEVTASIPGVRRTEAIGPHGWREAIEEMLTEVGWRLR